MNQHAHDARSALRIELWRIALPVLALGMIGAISFIEAPLKFQAPGITIPLGLGIGRLVFMALNTAEGIILGVLTILVFWPRTFRITGARMGVWIGLIVVFAAKILVIRPPLNARTDLVLAGAEPGQSPWHYIYIAADLATMALLLAFAILGAKAALRNSQLEPGSVRQTS